MKNFIALIILCCMVQTVFADFTFDDIDYWVGEGSNSSAIAICWNESGTASESMVWGYNWNGTACGADMVSAVVAADSKLFAMTEDTSSGFGAALAGLGYDLDGDGNFGITNGTITYTQEDFLNGVVAASNYDYDGWTTTDEDDIWASGWYDGFWSYWHDDETEGALDPFEGAGEWEFSNLGMTGKALYDGSWNGWGYDADFDSFSGGSGDGLAEPINPVAASIPEPATLALLGLGSLILSKRREQ